MVQRMFGYLCIVQLLPLWCDKIKDAIRGTGQGHAPDQQDDQHNIGECGCEINHLCRKKKRYMNMRNGRSKEQCKNVKTEDNIC